jgi:hypothetical protein
MTVAFRPDGREIASGDIAGFVKILRLLPEPPPEKP